MKVRLTADLNVSIRPDLERALRRDPEVRAFVLKETEKGTEHAQGLVNRLTGDYNMGLKTETRPDGGARISATAEHSVYLEVGTRYMAGQHILARTGAWLEGGADDTGRTTPSWTNGIPNGLTTVEARAMRRGLRRTRRSTRGR